MNRRQFVYAAAGSLAAQTPATVGFSDLEKKVVYHSPQTPGYTCWVGCWQMPDGTLMLSFHQANGPFEGRPGTRKDVLKSLFWPPQGKPEFVKYDMAGLDMQVIHLASANQGASWTSVSVEHAATPMNGWTCEPEVAASDGVIFRGVWGQYLPFYDVPQTGFWQSSRDVTQTWSAPRSFYPEQEWKTLPKRMRLLRDGRLAVSGAVARGDRVLETRRDWDANYRPALWFSEDRGEHWSAPLLVWDDAQVTPSEELDFAELPDGDLLVIIRVDQNRSRYQTVLRKDGKSWRPDPVRKLWIPHSGHPELLMTREGILLHLATDGIAWTRDKGEHWAYLEGRPRSGYYPRSMQLADGRVFCVYHVGGDNYYGQLDQRIEAITFRLKA